MLTLYAPFDRAAIEIYHSSKFDVDEIRQLTIEAANIGFTRVSVIMEESDLHDIAEVSRSLLRVPRTLIVVNSLKEARSAIRPRRTIIRSSSYHSNETANASKQGIRTLITTKASHVETMFELAKADGVTRVEDSIILDLSNDPTEVSSIRSVPNVTKTQVWDEVVGRSLLDLHPCYAYLCDLSVCHIKRSSAPRRIVVDTNKHVIPYTLSDQYSLGTLENPTDIRHIIDNRAGTKSWHAFRELAREALLSFVVAGKAELFSLNAILKAAESDFDAS